MNKKGADMTIGTIVVIVLAVLVLVFLVFGFSQGWGNLADKIFNFGGKPNVDTIVSACSVACSTNSQYDYCSHKRKLVLEDKTKYQDVTCIQLEQGVAAKDSDLCMWGSKQVDANIFSSLKDDCKGNLIWDSETSSCKVGDKIISFSDGTYIEIADDCKGSLVFTPKSPAIPKILKEACTSIAC
ncbi:MAG TPA: hypothetical protein P5277_03810 [Candidatus Paceibacterota bacterium]|nr:hypothetical protein [Candidatus Paceibacterota bacterium]